MLEIFLKFLASIIDYVISNDKNLKLNFYVLISSYSTQKFFISFYNKGIFMMKKRKRILIRMNEDKILEYG